MLRQVGYRCSRVLLGDARQMWDVCPHIRDGFELVVQWIDEPDNLGYDDLVRLVLSISQPHELIIVIVGGAH